MSTRSERIRIAMKLNRELAESERRTTTRSRTPSARITPEKARRIVVALQLEAGLPVTDFERRPNGRPHGKGEPMDIRDLIRESEENERRQARFAKRFGLQVPRSQMLSAPWRPWW